MTRRQNEAVAIAPDGMVRVEAQELLPDGVDHRRQRHRRARVARVGGLNSVHAQRANRVDGELVDGIAFQGREIGGGLGHGQPSSVRNPNQGSRSIGGRRRTGMPECTLSPTTLRGKNRPAHRSRPRGFGSRRHRSQLWIWSKIRCADALLMEWPGSVRMISVIRRPFRSAISVHLLSG